MRIDELTIFRIASIMAVIACLVLIVMKFAFKLEIPNSALIIIIAIAMIGIILSCTGVLKR